MADLFDRLAADGITPPGAGAGANPASAKSTDLFDRFTDEERGPAVAALRSYANEARGKAAPSAMDKIMAAPVPANIDEARARDNPPQAEDDWLDIGRKLFARVGPLFKKSIGGGLQALIEGSAGTPPNAFMTGFEQEEIRKEAEASIALARDRKIIPGQRMAEAATADLAENEYQPGESTLKKYVPMVAEAVIQMVPAIAASFATRNPHIAGSVMGAQVAGSQYDDSRAAGRSVGASMTDSAFMAAAEAIGESIPVGILMKPGGKFLSRTLKAMGAEGLQEMFTETLQSGYDLGVLSPDMSWGEVRGQLADPGSPYWQGVKDAGIVGAFAGGALSVGVEGTHRAAASIGKKIAPGIKETAAQEAARPTPADEASPLDTGIIAAGRAEMAKAGASRAADTILSESGMPGTGSRVSITMPDGSSRAGVVDDAFNTDAGEFGAATGIKVKLDDGSTFAEHFDALADAGVTISPLAEADAIDASLAERAQTALADVETGQSTPAEPVGSPTPAGSPKPVADARAATASLYPDAVVTSSQRDKDDPLTKANPGSWHAKSNAAVDVRPIKGMTFEQFVQGYRDAGHQIIEAINETGKGRSKHATGDHWHIVLGERGEQQAVEPFARDAQSGKNHKAVNDEDAQAQAPDEAVWREQDEPATALDQIDVSSEVRDQLSLASSDDVIAWAKRWDAVNLPWQAASNIEQAIAVRPELAEQIRGANPIDPITEPKYAAVVDAAVQLANSSHSAPPSSPQKTAEGATVARPESTTPAARVEGTNAGKSVAITDASQVQLEAIKAAVPNVKPIKRKDGAVVYSKKHEAAIRAALDSSSQQMQDGANAAAPATPAAVSAPETSTVSQTGPGPVNADQANDDITGARIDKEWSKFADDSGTLGIPRADMPQINAEHRGAMVQFLGARGIEHEDVTVPAASLRPTQAEFSRTKVEKAIDFTGGDRAILTSSDGYVLDGHHQWMAKRAAGEDVRTIRIDAPIRQLLATVNEFPSATASDGATRAQPAQVARSAEQVTPPAKIDDFGEKLVGARKDYALSLKERMSAAGHVDIAVEPLSKSWPEPDYQKLLDGGADPYVVASIRALREAIPTKPQKSWRLRGWVNGVRMARDYATELLNDGAADGLDAAVRALENQRQLLDLQGSIDLYLAVGHARSLKGISLQHHSYSLYRGEKFDPPKSMWAVERKAKATAMSNWPRELAVADTKEAAIAAFKARIATLADATPSSRDVKFDIYSRRGKPDFIIGKKIGKTVVDLKTFTTVKEAREYLRDNQAALVKLLESYKDVPDVRRPSNSPRVGINHRDGADVTPEQFAEAFGFRGVQFGNYVEGARRQEDLNEAYDALLDLAGVLGIPAKALSLNGKLGLAFGARGKGGKNAAAAHFEPGNVVINLTKRGGAGSLAHEWWHSLDNYFARKNARGDSFMTAQDRGAGDVRPEMLAAFREVMVAIRQTSLKRRSAELDKRRSKAYWSTDIEMSARAFESYVIAKLADNQFSNDYLANIVSEAAFALEGGYPYVTAAEIPAIRAGFDNFFQTVEVDDSGGTARLYSFPEEDGGEAVATLTGEELGPYDDVLQLGRNARDWFRKNLRLITVVSSDGATVRFSRAGEGKIVGGDRILRAVPAIPSIIERGRHAGPLPVSEKWTARGVVATHSYVGAVDIAGERHSFGVMVHEFADGRRFYNLTDQPAVEGIGSRSSLTEGRPKVGARVEITPDRVNIFEADQNGNVLSIEDARDTSAETDREASEAFTPALEGSARDEANLAAVNADLKTRVEALGLTGRVTTKLVAAIAGHPQAAGLYHRGIIQVALHENQAPIDSFNHEAIHALRDAGLFMPAEWRSLEAAARADKAMMGSIKKRYSHLTAEEQVEEAVADRYMKWARGVRERGFIQTAFERVREVLRAFSNALRGNGFNTADSVMRAIEGGEVGRRTSSSDTAQDSAPRLSIPNPLNRTPNIEAQRDGMFADIGSLITTARDKLPGGEQVRSAIETLRIKLQDRMLPVLRLQDRVAAQLGRDLAEHENPYLGEELMSGRIGARLERLTEDIIDPLFADLAASDITVDELESYLYARHAPERNARIREINPEFGEGEGSGMTDIEALAITNRIKKAGKLADMERLAGYVDQMLADSVQTRIDGGLLSEEDAAAWRETYQHYVPLRGHAELDEDSAVNAPRINKSSGITVKGKESKRAFGRKSKADQILAYSILQANEAIVRAETNMVARSFYDLAKAAPDKGFWQINKVERRPVFNKTTGQVQYEMQSRISAEDAPYTVSVKIEGVEHRVTMERSSKAAVAVADAMRNLTSAQFEFLSKTAGAFTRFFSQINTRFSPPFIITNALRDLETAAVTLKQFNVPGLTTAVMGDWRSALLAPSKGDGEWTKWRREWELAGGKISFNQQGDLAQIQRDIDGQMKRLQNGTALGKAWRTFFDTIDQVNDGVERAVRLSVYKNMRTLGNATPAQAASAARNVTVNFTRRGQWGTAVNALYAFFNASTQGSATLITAAVRSKSVRTTMAGFVVAGFALDMLNALIGDDDDDGMSFWDKVPDHEKSRNAILVIPGTGGKTVKIPLAYGLNALFSMGRNISAVMRGAAEPGKAALATALDAADAFNPVGDGGSWWNIIAPTILDPWVDISMNKDFTGRPIQPNENPFAPPPTPSSNYFPGVSPIAKAVTGAVNKATGGDEVLPGAVSVSPEVAEYLFGYFTGGAGRFADQLTTLGMAPFDPETELSVNDFPFVRTVFGAKASWIDKSTYYDRVKDVELLQSHAKAYRERADADGLRALAMDEEKVVRMIPATKQAQKEMAKARKFRRESQAAYDRGQLDAAAHKGNLARAKDAEGVVVSAYNSLWNRTVLEKMPAGEH